jgi:glyceraldehyde 3-phosphate dehydrogenase
MPKLRLAINGFGRIGRHTLKVALEKKEIEVVAINDLTDNKTLAHLLKYDTAYPEFAHEVSYDDENLIIDGKKIKAYSEKDPASLPWADLKVRTKEKAGLHLKAGAKKVVISAPGKGEGIDGFVRGVNCESYAGQDIIDAASCTTNCAAPVMDVFNKEFGVEKGLLSTIHAYTAGQNLQDGPHKDLRRARAAMQNVVPTSTGAAVAVAKVIPDLAGKFDGSALRIPVITVSLVDLSVVLKKDATKEEINEALTKASKGYLKGILDVTNEPLVSSDFIGNPYSSIVDLGLTNVVGGNLAKVVAWYDNEWGYANRLVEMALIAFGKK